MAHIKNVTVKPIFINIDGKRVNFNPDEVIEVKGGLNDIKKGSEINAYYVEKNMLISVQAPKEDKKKEDDKK